jgi:riboflavin synthase
LFTGLIEEVGRLRTVKTGRGTTRIVIEGEKCTRDLKTGDSVAVSGVCLTALDITPKSFRADLADETVKRTSLSQLAPGTLVNLELPTRAGTPLGGHVVQGHVDGVGKLIELAKIPGGDDWNLVVELPEGLERYVVHKGSISIEGISLTVARVDGRNVTVAIIPHTYEATNLRSLKPGALVNIEADILAKYAEKMFQGEKAEGVTMERLISEGF